MHIVYIIGKEFFPNIANGKDIIFIEYRKQKYCNLLKKLVWYIIRTYRAYSGARTCHWGARILFGDNFVDELRKITHEDKVLIWDIPSIKTNIMLHQELDTDEVMTFLWNPVCSLYKSRFSIWKFLHYKEKYHFLYSTFDSYDARKHNMMLLPQVFDLNHLRQFVNDNTEKAILYDVTFLAALKGREYEIYKTYERLKDEELIAFFYLFHPNTRIRIPEVLRNFLHTEKMLYDSYIKQASRSKAILEIVQKGQEGMSLRPLEALMLKKKLITNNLSMVNEKIYLPDNVYILNYPNKYHSIKEFLEAPYVEIPEELKNGHDIRVWMRQNVIYAPFSKNNNCRCKNSD
jgi:hypothetical protein